jgi:ATP-dependent exoDNAse (exonuclease V) beta subunit
MDQDTHRSAAQLLARVEELFADSESIVVAAFEVSQCTKHDPPHNTEQPSS